MGELARRRTKIVATMGPAVNSRQSVVDLMQAGVNIFRINLSHGHPQQWDQWVSWIREVSLDLRAPVAIMADLQGPKIRVGTFENGFIDLKPQQRVYLRNVAHSRDPLVIGVENSEVLVSLQPGDRLLLDDGKIILKVVEIHPDGPVCQVLSPGRLMDKKGLNVPGRRLQISSLTHKDWLDVDWALKAEVNVIALSFVQAAKDIQELKNYLRAKTSQVRRMPKICAKIELKQAIENLDEILELADLIMVARGDLAVEVGHPMLPIYQKLIINKANRYRKPVICATQMLDSMIQNPQPTRAEVTDVANAVLDGADGLMLSNETAVGQYPIECVKTMHAVIQAVEAHEKNIYHKLNFTDQHQAAYEAIAESAVFAALKLSASVIVCLTTTGKTAQIISALRPKALLIAVTSHFDVLGDLELLWGFQTILIPHYESLVEVKRLIQERLCIMG